MIQVDNQAQAYILEKGGAITLEHGNQTALCCGSVNFGPDVRVGKPQKAGYSVTVNNGLSIYLPRGFHSPYELTIKLRTVLGFKSLYIDGWKLL